MLKDICSNMLESFHTKGCNESPILFFLLYGDSLVFQPVKFSILSDASHFKIEYTLVFQKQSTDILSVFSNKECTTEICQQKKSRILNTTPRVWLFFFFLQLDYHKVKWNIMLKGYGHNQNCTDILLIISDSFSAINRKSTLASLERFSFNSSKSHVLII